MKFLGNFNTDNKLVGKKGLNFNLIGLFCTDAVRFSLYVLIYVEKNISSATTVESR